MREYTKDDYGWFYLDMFDDITLVKKIKISAILENGSKMFELDKYKDELMHVLEDDEFELIRKVDKHKLKKSFKETIGKNINFITINSPEYPDLLKETPCPPMILYYIGNIDLLKTPCISIIGSRICTGYGKTVTERFAKELAYNGFTIVSGLAEGIDTIAHKSCLSVKGNTIAVLCGGLDSIYPSINRNLAIEILRNNGLLISENKMGVESQKFMFPIRNRIMAGLSLGVLLTEASEKSGTKHTINHAIDANRNVYCVPGSILNERGSFGNLLIKTCQSIMVTESRDIVEDLGFTYKDISEMNQQKVKTDDVESDLIRKILMEDEYVHFDKILEKSKMDIKKLNSLLTKLELSGIIKKMAGNLYMLKK
ncbi:MAG: DNA-processing protein DprA [Christensenellales bacterium]